MFNIIQNLAVLLNKLTILNVDYCANNKARRGRKEAMNVPLPCCIVFMSLRPKESCPIHR